VEIPGHLLQADDIGPGYRPGNPSGIEFSVQTNAKLDVLADEFHDIL
jgi:hypothetical protein